MKLPELPGLVDKVLTDFLAHINNTQPGSLSAMYLTGSIPLGDYHSKKSDIDFLVILNEQPSKKVLQQFERIHKKIERRYNQPKLNGYYLTVEGIKNNQQTYPSFFAGKMHLGRPFELDKVTLLELKTSSYNICGVPASQLPIEVSFDNVVSQLHENINDYWIRWIKQHSFLTLGYLYLLLFPRLSEWGILGVARQLYTLDTGSITSKLNAGIYCLHRLPQDFHEIVQIAIKTREINKTQLKPSFRRANKTIACMKVVIEEFNKTFKEKMLPLVNVKPNNPKS